MPKYLPEEGLVYISKLPALLIAAVPPVWFRRSTTPTYYACVTHTDGEGDTIQTFTPNPFWF